ncbi:hypothetical protein ACFXQA_07075 [Microbacterium sp. P07]|uniref:hypothetical protein n=1 Tax=Microbacterium sp. P07 TaxID=3366952 RepID=UPI0037473E40
MPESTSPYPLPERWRMSAAKPIRRGVAVAWIVVALAFAGGAFAALLREDIGGAIVFTALFAAVGLGVGVGYQHAGAERGLPRFINAVTLSQARVRPPDSWIHFFRETGPGLWMVACFAGTGFAASTALVWAGALAVGDGSTWALIVVAPLLLGALIVALAGGIGVLLRWRHASFARRPIGISIGRHGVVRYYIDDVDVWPWESITEVRATVSAVDSQTGDFSPGIVLGHAADADGRVEHEYSLDGYEAHAWLIYTAMRFWAEHAEHRDELSTTFAQQRITGWRDVMGSAAPAPTTQP